MSYSEDSFLTSSIGCSRQFGGLCTSPNLGTKCIQSYSHSHIWIFINCVWITISFWDRQIWRTGYVNSATLSPKSSDHENRSYHKGKQMFSQITLNTNSLYSLLLQTPPLHYSDVIMGAMASQIISPTIVYSTVYSALHHWPLSGEFVGDRWIPHTNG